jgi:four helix bundle protein
MKIAVKQNFHETSFASPKESVYCRYLAKELKYIPEEEYQQVFKLKEEIAAMIYSTIKGITKKRD